jgi:AbrB family looped-hinge helix DNA binding protein
MTSMVRKKGQVTIPAGIRAAARIEEGDPVDFEVVAEGVLLRPKKVIDSTQAWFWTAAWQERVHASIQELEAGRGEQFENEDDFLASLDAA